MLIFFIKGKYTVKGYYAEKLAGRRLERCYEVAPPRVRQYLEAEIRYVLKQIRPSHRVLELGCGYGRVTERIARAARLAVGIDSAWESLERAQERVEVGRRCAYAYMNACRLGFVDQTFHMTVCVQNGICVFGVDPEQLLAEALRVTRMEGIVLFSTYADRFWPERLAWFEAQAAEGLIGPLNRVASREGTIVCKDGFHSGRKTKEELLSLSADLEKKGRVEEVDGSSLFLRIVK